jgi:hypothetical protein
MSVKPAGQAGAHCRQRPPTSMPPLSDLTRAAFALALVACASEIADEAALSGAQLRRARAALQAAAAEAHAEAPAPPLDPGPALQIHHPRELDHYPDLTRLERLDLALSEPDRAGQPGPEGDPEAAEDPCLSLDLFALAGRLPGLRALRISGCEAAVHGGLQALAGLESLELVDLPLDGVTIGRILALGRLRELTLTRVRPGAEPLLHLRGAQISRLVLRELAPDSELALLAGLLPGLRELDLIGPWAGHKAMLAVAKASRLRALTLVDTQIGNFSLNQVKGLAQLERLDLRGATFNESSPLYLRELPITAFTCACPGLGDVGLRALRHVRGLRRVELLASKATGAGVEALAELPNLEALTVLERDIGPQGFAALARVAGLRELDLRVNELADPTVGGLGALTGLRRLTLRCPVLDDRVAAQLRELVHLEHLDLGGTQISDAGLAALAGMSGLRTLILHHTRITHRGLAHLAGLRALEVLELDHTDLVDGGVAHLAGLQRLRELRLDATLITDGAMVTLAGLLALERLNLADTVITADGAARLAGHPKLRSVNLAGTRARPGAITAAEPAR